MCVCVNANVHAGVYVCVLVYEVICAFLLDVVGVSKQPDDLVTGK